MNAFANAVKAFIVKDGQVLLLKRRLNDTHKPGAWDLPGGRLEVGENPFDGLKREAQEEAKIEIEIVMPLDVHNFTRDDGQKIQLTIFLCHLVGGEVSLSEEHTEYKWLNINSSIQEFPEWLHGVIEKYNNLDITKI